MNFLQEPSPRRAWRWRSLPGIRRVVAENPGPMTYHGTNTYLLDWAGGVAVLDPGPDDEAHVRHVIDLAGGPVRAILLSHGHHDHWGALAALRTATGAPLYAWPGPAAPTCRSTMAVTSATGARSTRRVTRRTISASPGRAGWCSAATTSWAGPAPSSAARTATWAIMSAVSNA